MGILKKELWDNKPDEIIGLMLKKIEYEKLSDYIIEGVFMDIKKDKEYDIEENYLDEKLNKMLKKCLNRYF